jgi:hypothetical protein
MKIRLTLLYLLLIFSVPLLQTSAQDIEVIRGDSVIHGDVGVTELVLYAHVVNISQQNQTIFLVRTINDLPPNWTSSLCFYTICFPPNEDSVVTAEPIPPLDTVEVSVHFYPDLVTAGTGHVQIQLGTMHNPSVRTTINLIASTEPSAVDEQVNPVNKFNLLQNYPNPFNPTTRISYVIPRTTNVNLKVYNITGNEVATLVNEVKGPGIYNVEFNGKNLSSGVYFYKLTAGKYSAVRKMILLR